MRGCFAVRAALVVALLTIGVLVYGINEVIQAGKYSQPKVISYEQFVQQKPGEGWYRITGALLDVTDGIRFHEENQKDDIDHVSEIYVPVMGVAGLSVGSRQPTTLIVQTRDPALLESYRSFNQSTNSMSKEQADAYIVQHARQLLVQKDVDGTIKSGLNSEESDVTKELKRLNTNLDPNFVILEEGKKPSMALGLGLTALGVLLASGQVLYYIWRAAARIGGGAAKL